MKTKRFFRIFFRVELSSYESSILGKQKIHEKPQDSKKNNELSNPYYFVLFSFCLTNLKVFVKYKNSTELASSISTIIHS